MLENLSALLVGVLFGASLDLAGFGNPKRLVGQFMLRDFSMFKVMFGAIVVASSLYFLALHLGLAPVPRGLIPTLDMGLLLGALMLGAGLVVGGYCPGTALAGAAGGRVDAALFFLMVYPGYRCWAWLEPQWDMQLHVPLVSSRATLPELLGTSPLAILLLLATVCLAGWMLGNLLEERSASKQAR